MSNNKPLIKISGKIQNIEKKVKNIKPKQSNFLLTLNTNQQFKEYDPHLKNDNEIFDVCINELLKNVDQYLKLPDTDQWNEETIKNVDIDYTIERGSKKGQLHIHIMFKTNILQK